ncbi:MAG: hypothetical protein R3E08_02995 [Thiotrichaceae bacterium]
MNNSTIREHAIMKLKMFLSWIIAGSLIISPQYGRIKLVALPERQATVVRLD